MTHLCTVVSTCRSSTIYFYHSTTSLSLCTEECSRLYNDPQSDELDLIENPTSDDKMLFLSVTLLAITASICPIEVDGFMFGNNLRDSTKLRSYYDEIDSFLRDKVPREDINDSMNVVERWAVRESKTYLNQDRALRLRALLQLKNLLQTDGPGRCSLSTSRILQNNDLSLRGALSKLSPGEIPKRRIERLVNHYALAFIQECDYKEVLKEMNSDSLKLMTNIVGAFLSTRAVDELVCVKLHTCKFDPSSAIFLQQHPTVVSNFAKKLENLRWQDTMVIYKLLSNARRKNSDPSVKYLSGKRFNLGKNVDIVYREFLRNPCLQYKAKVESSFGNSWALAQSKKLHKRMGTEGSLYENLAYYYGCTFILNKEDDLIEGLEAIAKRLYDRS